MKNSRILILLFLGVYQFGYGQKHVFEILNNDDLSFYQKVDSAEIYLDEKGDEGKRERKHFERWKFENRLHLDHKGFIRSREDEQKAFSLATSKMIKSTASSNWQELGPQNFTHTTSWNPGVGRVTSVAVNPANNNIIYVSSPGGGIWKTTDYGQNWTALINQYEWMNVYHVAISPSNTNILYASLQNAGVIKSSDAGLTWQSTGGGPSRTKKVLIDPGNSNKIYATAGNGLFVSTNGGTSWTQRIDVSELEDVEFKPGDLNTMYASGTINGGIYRSSDGGTNWGLVGGDSLANGERTLVAVSPANPSVVYVGQASGSGFGALFKSTDSGLTFTPTIKGNTANGTNFFGYTGTSAGGQAWYDMALAINPADANHIMIAGIICWASTDGGASFTQLTEWFYPNGTGYNHADVHYLGWTGTTIYSGSDGGIYRSTDNGDNWIDMSTGLGIKQLYRIANSPTHDKVMAGGAQDNGSLIRQTGGNFVDWLGADGMETIINPKNSLIIIGTSQNGDLYKTSDGGNTIDNNIAKPAGGNWVTPIAWHPTDSSTIYGGWDAVYKSTNMGQNWSNISASLGYVGKFNDLAIAPSNPNVIYASVNNKLYVTQNGGTTWSTYTYPDFIEDIAVKHNDPSKIYVAMGLASQPLVMSTNYGATFSNISAGLPLLSARSVVVNDDSNEEVLVGMTVGVYYRSNSQPSWQLMGSGLPQVQINEIEIVKSVGKLRVATYGRGIWETDLIICPLNIVHSGNVTGQAYSAAEEISSTGNVATGTTYSAGKRVILSPGFQAGTNEVFEATIGGCAN